MKAIVALVCVSVVLYGTMASPCSDSCNLSCDITKQSCDLTRVLGDLCTVNYDMCTQTCGTVCNCVDSCNDECNTRNAACNVDGYDFLRVISCQYQNAACVPTCQTTCAANAAAATVAGGGAA